MSKSHFVPIRRKLLTRTMGLLVGVFGVVVVAIILQSLQMVHRNTETIDSNIRKALKDKGAALTSNTSLALTGMVEDNAITNVEQLLCSTMAKAPDVVYAIYMNNERVPWVLASSDNPKGQVTNPKPLEDPMALWAAGQSALASKENSFHGLPVIEFAAPVRSSQETLGWVRYGLSTAAMRQAQEAAARDGITDRNAILGVLLGLAIVTLGVAFFMARRFSDHLARRIGLIVESTRIIAEGNYDVPVVASDNDELGMLGTDVDRMRLSIKALTASLADQERLRQEMELARRIQTALLPTTTEGLNTELEVAALMLPAEEVGGDYYDAALDRDGFLWITIGDVSGHGVTPGLIMMMAQTAHSAIRSGAAPTPSEMVLRLNRTLHENASERLHSNLYMTFVALRYQGEGKFEHAGAHLDILIHRAATNTVELLSTHGVWLAIQSDISHAVVPGNFKLEVGDTLVLYTDGLPEAASPAGDMLDMQGMERLIKEHVSLSPKEMAEAMIKGVREWCADVRSDDMTIVTVRRVS
jgi:serine phosphatase RsbU (regulator of sigma subunit)